jgi:hypothetical protein
MRLAAERSDTNVDLLFISTLKPWSIIWGKFLSAVVLVLLIFSACAPFMTFTYLLRGIDIPTILIVLGMDFLAVIAATMLAIFLATVPSNRGLKGLLFLLGLWILIMVFAFTMQASGALVFNGVFVRPDSEEFWGVAVALVVLVLAEMGQYFVWSVALVSPLSANRSVLVRSYTAARCLVTLGAAIWFAYAIRHPGPIIVWQGLMLFLFGLQLTISISEREHLGPRVARTIPRKGLLRGLAFLFYSGAAGGILFSVLMVAFTLAMGPVLALLMEARFRSGASGSDAMRVAFIMTLIALYVYDYGLLAVVCRRVIFGHHLRSSLTWLVALILAAVGCCLPYVFLLIFPQNASEFERQHPWILLPNPMASISVVSYSVLSYFPYAGTFGAGTFGGFDTWCLVFVGSWAVVVTLLCLPWMVRQLRDFRPPSRKAANVVALPETTPQPLGVGLIEPSANGAVPAEAVIEPPGVQKPRRESHA